MKLTAMSLVSIRLLSGKRITVSALPRFVFAANEETWEVEGWLWSTKV